MKQIEFFQKALANSVEILLNTEAQVTSHLRWLAETKRLAIERATKDKEFNSDDICDYDEWSQANMARDKMMRVVGVGSALNDYNLVELLKARGRGLFGKTMTLYVFFMRNPDEILQSKAKLTPDEKTYLKKMKYYYDHRDHNGHQERSEMSETNQSLRELKHKYNILLKLEWQYNFNDVISDNFLTKGIRAGNVTIAATGGNISD